MSQTYEHINGYEREVIAQMLKEEKGWSEIGRKLGRSPSSIYREYYRNRQGEQYMPRQADHLARDRRRIARRPRKIVGQVAHSVKRGLRRYRSPEQVAGRRLLKEGMRLSVMTIYRFLESAEGQPFRQYLRGPSKRRRRNKKLRERIHNRTMIDQRPPEVDKRERFGDVEGDTVRGPMSSSACVLTLVDRKSQYLVARLLPNRGAAALNDAVVSSMRGRPFKTLTVDNGMEFASHEELSARTGVPVYFAHEKCPWERGLNEQVNGLLRQFFPKGTDFSQVTPAQLRRAVRYINERPRKSLGYRTPKEVMERHGPLHL